MPSRSTGASRKKIRLSISLEPEDHARLKALVEGRHPRLSMQYVIEFAIAQLLDQDREAQLPLSFGNPLVRGRR